MQGMKTAILVAALAAMMVVPGFASAAESTSDRNITVQVRTGSTTRMGGGDWVAIQAGDVTYAVVYGNEDNPNNIFMLTEQKRYLGAADVYSEDGEFRGTKGISVSLVFAAKLAAMVEYRDTNGDGLFDLRWLSNVSGLGDKPVKSASLKFSWTMQNMVKTENGNTTRVSFNLTAHDIPYQYVWSGAMDAPRKGMPSDGSIEEVTFTCHLTFVKGIGTVQSVPWFTVVAKDNGDVVNSTYDGQRNYTTEALNGSIKYDHSIKGWDFGSNSSGLAIETGIMAGVHAYGAVAERIRGRHMNMNCVMNGTQISNSSNGNGPTTPLLARDTLRLQNEWEGVGNLTWADNVTVDGQERQMKFQVQNGGALTFTNNNTVFSGFLVRAAFLYPAGQSIYHDPSVESTSTTLAIEDTVTAFPKLITLMQVGLAVTGVVLAIGLSIFMRNRAGRPRSPGTVERFDPMAKPPRPPAPPQGGKAT